MALYDVIHEETGETKQVNCSVHDITQWYIDNPGWKRDWSHGCAMAAEAGEWKDKLIKQRPGWKEVLNKVKNSPKSKAKDLY